MRSQVISHFSQLSSRLDLSQLLSLLVNSCKQIRVKLAAFTNKDSKRFTFSENSKCYQKETNGDSHSLKEGSSKASNEGKLQRFQETSTSKKRFIYRFKVQTMFFEVVVDNGTARQCHDVIECR